MKSGGAVLKVVAEAASARHWIGGQPITGKKVLQLVVQFLIQMILIGIPK